MLKYMLDTNIVIYTIKNKPASVKEAFVKHYGQTSISSITMMELAYGAEKSANPERNLNFLLRFAARRFRGLLFHAPPRTSEEPLQRNTS